MNKPVLIDPGLLTPNPQNTQDGVCIHCGTERAKWMFRKEESWCSYCFLYETDWAKTNIEGILSLARAVEQRTNRSMVEDDCRVTVSESDRILSAVVLSSLVKYNNDRKKT